MAEKNYLMSQVSRPALSLKSAGLCYDTYSYADRQFTFQVLKKRNYYHYELSLGFIFIPTKLSWQGLLNELLSN